MDRGYGQYCPVAKGAEVFAARWIPLIIRNLHLGCRSFGEILTQVHMGRLPLGQAIEAGAWETHGPPSLARALMTWGGLSPFAQVVPACDEQVAAGPRALGPPASGPAPVRTPASRSP